MSFLLNVNFNTSKEQRFDTSNAKSVSLSGKTFIGYSQTFNSGAQSLLAGVRTQLTVDGLGAGTTSTQILWDPVNNRINLQDSKVGDYIDCYLLLPYVGSGFIPSLTVQLDFSPTLDGSQVITQPIVGSVLSIGGNYEYNIKFSVTEPMKENGVGIMVVSSVNATITGAQIVLENMVGTTA